MKKSVMCIVTNEREAESIVALLRAAKFEGDDISLLFPNRSGTKDFAHEHNTKAPEGAIAGVGTGGALGGALGLLIGIGALSIPGLGPLIAAGPLLAMLSGAAAGATVGGVAGALVGLGIPEMEAKRYEGKIRSGNILLSVHADTSEEVKRAEKIMRAANADDICATTESSVPLGSKAEPTHSPVRP